MTIQIIGGPWNRKSAEDTAAALGDNCSVFSKERKDTEGFGTGEFDYWVERDDALPSGKIFGYGTKEFMARQYR